MLTGGKTLDPNNLINIVNGNSYVLVLAIGMVMVIIAGHIDLSVGSVAAFVGIIVAESMFAWNWPWPAAMLLGLVVGAMVGAWQGFWVAYVGIPAFIVTLAGMLFFRGAQPVRRQFDEHPGAPGVHLHRGWLPPGYWRESPLQLPDPGPRLLAALAIVWQEWRHRRIQTEMKVDKAPLWVVIVKISLLLVVIGVLSFLFATGRAGTSYPVAGIILGVLVIGYSFITSNTIIGRHIYAVGGNWRAAELSGVKIQRVNFFVMWNMSVIAALAGMMWIARSHASGPGDGVGWELDAIAAVFIGGAAVSGGIGTIVGSIIGGLVIAVLNNGLQLLGVGADLVQMIKGLVLLAAVGIDVYSKRQGRPSILGRFSRTRTPDITEGPAVLPSGSAEETSRGGAASPK